MMTPQLGKIAIKKRASHPSSIRESELDFRKLVDKLEQAETRRNRKSQTKRHNSDKDLSEKITEILNIYEKNPNFKGKQSFKNGVTIAEDTVKAFLNTDKNNKTTRINHKNTKSRTNHFINTRKRSKCAK